jgi:hypothetical protein
LKAIVFFTNQKCLIKYITVLCLVTQQTMSDLVALAQEIAKWQTKLEQEEATMFLYQEAILASQKQKDDCERVLFDLKNRMCALCKNGQPKSPEPPVTQHTVLLDANGARQFDREQTIAYDNLPSGVTEMQEAGPSQASKTHAADKPAAGGSKNARCPFVTGKAWLPCAFKKACPECCADPESAQMQTPVKKRKRGVQPKIKAAKVPLTAQGAAAVDSVLRHINSKEKVSDDATEEDEDYHDEDECGLTALEQAKPCWCQRLGCWETYVHDKFEDWRLDNYPFLNLTDLSQTAQNILKTCTLGRFITFAGDVDQWHIPAVQSIEEWSKRLAEFLER